MTSIRSVAEKSGVSIGTVSRVLNNKPGVSEETREHVRETAKSLGYILPKRSTRQARKVTHIGVLTHHMLKQLPADPFYGEIFHGVEKTCHENHICISYSKLEPINNQLSDLPAMFNDERISGIILLGGLPFEWVTALDKAIGQPIILVDNYYPDCPWDAVLIDNINGSYLATKHLIQKGTKNIAMIAGTEHPSILERIEGYQKALSEAGLSSQLLKKSALNPESGEDGVVEILHESPGTTAIFCSNDMQAIGAIAKLGEMDVSVPKDISIIGFDNISTGQYTAPPLSTINVDRLTMGKLAAQLLIDRVQDPDRTVVKSVVGTKLIERKSVSAPKNQARLE